MCLYIDMINVFHARERRRKKNRFRKLFSRLEKNQPLKDS